MKPEQAPSLPQDEPALCAVNLNKRYKKAKTRALDEFSLTIQQGEFFGLLGVNGAGKTTAVSIFTGLSRPDAGTVHLFGIDILKKTKKGKAVTGLVPQQLALYEQLTLTENLHFFGSLYGINGDTLRQVTTECLAIAGLADRARDKVSSLSGGMKRRLHLVAGLINRPQLLFLDEPTVGADTHSRHLMHEHLKELNRKGTTILLTGHYLEEMEKLCTRIGVIDHGTMIAEGAPDELLEKAGEKSLEALFLRLTGGHEEEHYG